MGPAGDLGKAQSVWFKHALSILIHTDKIRPLTKCIFSLFNKWHCCKRSSVKAAVPGEWSIYLKHGGSELNIVSLGGGCH